MKIPKLSFYLVLILACLSIESKAQSLLKMPNLNQLITAKIDSAMNLDSLKNTGFKLYTNNTVFVKMPDYTKEKESPTPIPNAYIRIKDISVPIPTFKIKADHLPN